MMRIIFLCLSITFACLGSYGQLLEEKPLYNYFSWNDLKGSISKSNTNEDKNTAFFFIGGNIIKFDYGYVYRLALGGSKYMPIDEKLDYTILMKNKKGKWIELKDEHNPRDYSNPVYKHFASRNMKTEAYNFSIDGHNYHGTYEYQNPEHPYIEGEYLAYYGNIYINYLLSIEQIKDISLGITEVKISNGAISFYKMNDKINKKLKEQGYSNVRNLWVRQNDLKLKFKIDVIGDVARGAITTFNL